MLYNEEPVSLKPNTTLLGENVYGVRSYALTGMGNTATSITLTKNYLDDSLVIEYTSDQGQIEDL